MKLFLGLFRMYEGLCLKGDYLLSVIRLLGGNVGLSIEYYGL